MQEKITMIGTEPEFFKSKYFIMEIDNFHVRADLPKEIVELPTAAIPLSDIQTISSAQWLLNNF